MSRAKAMIGATRQGITEAHLRIPLALLQCAALAVLPPIAAKLYLDLLSTLRSTNNGNINASFSVLKHRGWRSKTTLHKALRQLEAAGLIVKTRSSSGVQNGSRVCNLYRFTHLESYDHPKQNVESHAASKDYLKIQSVKEARRAYRMAAEATPRKKTTVQNMDRDGTKSGPIEAINGTESGLTPPIPCPETGPLNNSAKLRKPNGHARYRQSTHHRPAA